MARLTQPLGGYASPGGGYTDMGPGRGLAPPIGVPPVNRYLGGYGQPANRLGPPQPALGFGNQVASPTLPPIPPTPGTGAGRPNRYLGGASQPGNTGLPPRQGDGPPTVTRQGNALPPPGGGGTLPPISPSPYSVNNPPTQLGPTLQPGVSRNYWGGPPARMNQVVDPRTGKRALGAANIMASMSAGGWKPKGMPDFNFTFGQADAMRGQAMSDLGAAYSAGTLSPQDREIYENMIRYGDSYDPFNNPEHRSAAANLMYESTYGNPAYEYDYQGNYVGTGAEGGGFLAGGRDVGDQILNAYGWGDLPRVNWAGDWPTTDELQSSEQAYYDYLRKYQGFAPDPTPLDAYGANPINPRTGKREPVGTG